MEITQKEINEFREIFDLPKACFELVKSQNGLYDLVVSVGEYKQKMETFQMYRDEKGELQTKLKKENCIDIYTSYYKKMQKRIKEPFDLYVQVSRSVFCPGNTFYGCKVNDLLDIEFSALGNFWDLEDYEENIKKEEPKALEEFGKLFITDKSLLKDFDLQYCRAFLLCHENIEKKPCHRTTLANMLNSLYNSNILEY